MAQKKIVKAETVQEPKTEVKQAEAKPVKKWDAGKYKVLKTYLGSLGVFHAGKVYELTKEQAEAFGKAGEIEVWL